MRRVVLLGAMALVAAGCGSTRTSNTPAHTARATGTTSKSATVKVNVSTGSIPKYLRERVRPIGRGIRFHPSLSGTPSGRCRPRFTPRYQAHIEVFGANKVVLLPAGIGTRGPRRSLDGQLTRAACFGTVVTLDPTGTVYVRPHSNVTLRTLFSAWGEPLTATRVASFTGTRKLRVFVDGRPYRRDPTELRITPHAEIVIEAGAYVPPHTSFAFPPIPQVS